jgi:tetratricopeptide repeat protein
VALTMNGLGLHLARTGRLPEAEARIRKSLEMRRRVDSLGYAYALSLLDLGDVVGRQNRWTEAEALDREGLARLTTFVEPDDQRIAEAKRQLQAALRAQGKPVE